MRNKLYAVIAHLLNARSNCNKATPRNDEWFERHTDRIEQLVKDYMPIGSGIDSGTKLDIDASEDNKLVFTFEYHHMNDGGYYDGWTYHKAIVTPDLAFGYKLRITGPDRDGIKEYLHEVYHSALDSEVETVAAQPTNANANAGGVR